MLESHYSKRGLPYVSTKTSSIDATLLMHVPPPSPMTHQWWCAGEDGHIRDHAHYFSSSHACYRWSLLGHPPQGGLESKAVAAAQRGGEPLALAAAAAAAAGARWALGRWGRDLNKGGLQLGKKGGEGGGGAGAGGASALALPARVLATTSVLPPSSCSLNLRPSRLPHYLLLSFTFSFVLLKTRKKVHHIIFFCIDGAGSCSR